MKVNGKKLAELAGCTKGAVSKATTCCLIRRGPDGLYDTTDPVTALWLHDRDKKRGITPKVLASYQDKRGDTASPQPPKDTRATFAWPMVDFLDGRGFVPTVSGKVCVGDEDPDDLSDEWTIPSFPRSVRIVLGPLGSIRVFDVSTGREYPTKGPNA